MRLYQHEAVLGAFVFPMAAGVGIPSGNLSETGESAQPAQRQNKAKQYGYEAPHGLL
jgi:hypothetical protein